MQLSIGVVLAFVVVALSQAPPPSGQPNLFPKWIDGAEVVTLDDMSFVNEIAVQTYSPNNLTFFIYGESTMRTVFTTPKFYVGSTPNENWHVPFIDLDTFQNGSDIWGIGPINALYARNRTAYSGFQFEIAVITTKTLPNNPRGRIFLEQPIGFEGTFYSLHLARHDVNNITGYFCGFFPVSASSPGNLAFGIRRAHFNSSLFNGTNDGYVTNPWTSTPSVDDAVIFENAQLVTYYPEFKPFIFHGRNATHPNTTSIVVVDPYTNFATLIIGSTDPTIPLQVTGFAYVPTFANFRIGQISSAVIHEDIVFVGITVLGQGTGWIDVLNMANLTKRATSIVLPANYSDPRALVIDTYDSNPHLYVGVYGTNALLRISINGLNITGYQNLPFMLHSTWTGVATHSHIYFVTNEQHSKVFRVDKNDFCEKPCNEWEFCLVGKCV
eukprot:Phypoly_transcript_07455.p1 GENE.Phypoly_transcript_07455~~Phypoly_transcript_07455.p1  ORF type:complete len:440 (+),score=60.46 Phypoly_transcript_07455:98-1417(+)